MLKLRFEVFAALSLAAHVGLFAGVILAKRHPPPPPDGASAGGTQGAGAAAAVGGETFEVPEMEAPTEESPPGSEGAPIELDGQESPPPTSPGDTPVAQVSKLSHASRRGAPRVAGAAPSEPPLYGAVGDRTAGDLVTTFKRVFPIAVSSDPLWDRVPVGFYAEGEVTFYLGDDGALLHATASTAAAPAFRAAITRTATLLKHRLFTAQGATTHLHMVVRVTDHLVNHGAFTIDAAGSFELPSGRRVSVSIVEK